MQALVFDGQDLVVRDDQPQPRPQAGEALIRVLLAGICSTDLEITRGYAGFRGVPGHEFVGQVVACVERPTLVGTRVVGEINVGCGRCPICLTGRGAHCPTRSALGIRGRDGAFAQFLTLPAANLHPVPEDVPDQAAVFVEPLAAVLRIQQQIVVDPAQRIAVLGSGRLGQLAARTLAAAGCELVVVARAQSRSDVVLLRQVGIATAVADDLPADWADVVVDCSGQAAGFAEALRLVRPEGTLVLKSTYAGQPQADLSRLAVDEIRVIGSRCGPFEPALRLLESGRIDPLPMVAATYDLAEAPTAFAHARRRGVLKVLLKPAPVV